MEGSILSTYMFGILVLLLIIVIIVMYYLWNETKKNKNTITMLESDMEAIRGRLEKASKHIEQLESFEMPGGGAESMGMGKGGPSKMAQQHILEQLMGGLGMRDFMQTGEDDEDEYESESEDASDSGEESGEDMSGDASGSSEYETVDEDEGEDEGEGEEEENADDLEECDACGTHDEMDEHVMEEHEMESVDHDTLPDMSGDASGSETAHTEAPFVPVISAEMNDHINNLLGELNIDGGNNKKFPVKTPSECEVGVVMKGGDSKDYVVSLNKRGGKYWKPLK